ncbi:MAG: spore coat protein CotJB [Lachnospiraceae bacterium]|nr:spore coat protein CotJB [Lachnospiraceae bacterium]
MNQYRNMAAYDRRNNRDELIQKIGMLDFALVDLNLYLDTHPDDHEAMEYFMHFKKNLDMLRKEYTTKYGPLKVEDMANGAWDSWKWATEPMPWEVCAN